MPTSSAGTAVRDRTEELIRDTSSADAHQRQAACQHLAQQRDARALPVLLRCTEDQNCYVRQAACTGLAQVARKGDEEAQAALIARLGDGDAAVRRLACAALGQVASRGTESAVAALLGRLEDKDGGVRRAALRALEKVAEKQDAKVMQAVFARCNDTEAFVRHSAAEVLSRLAEEGNTQVLSRMIELGEDRDARVRCAATEALGKLAGRGDSRVLSSLLDRLDDECDATRRAAATSLGQVTFAPLAELEVQERHIKDLQFRGQHEVSARDRTIAEMRIQHAQEVARLQFRIDELEERLRSESQSSSQRIEQLEQQVKEQEWVAGVSMVIPHAGDISRFQATLPTLAGPEHHGVQITAPIWALRSLRMPDGSPSLGKPGKDASKAPSTPGVPQLPFDSPNGKEKRCLLSIFELFEQLSSGAVTPWELTEPSPLDVFVHKLEDGSWGLFCGSHQRLVSFLMHQACNRGEMMQVRCCLRSKEELSYWGWHWNSFYAGSNGLHASPKSPARGTPRSPSASPTRLRSANSMSSPRLDSGFSTPRGIGRGVRAPGPASPGHIQSQAAIAAAAAVMGAEAFQKPAAPRSSPGKASSQGETKEPLRRSKSAGNAAAFSPRTARRAVPKVQVINVGKS